jgi:hypothetical protein
LATGFLRKKTAAAISTERAPHQALQSTSQGKRPPRSTFPEENNLHAPARLQLETATAPGQEERPEENDLCASARHGRRRQRWLHGCFSSSSSLSGSDHSGRRDGASVHISVDVGSGFEEMEREREMRWPRHARPPPWRARWQGSRTGDGEVVLRETGGAARR